MDFTNYLSKSFLICFFIVRCFEDEILLYFMNFQKLLRIEELQIARDVFIKYEGRSYKLHKVAIGAVLFLMTITFVYMKLT